MGNGNGMDRRDFLRGVATAALAAGFVGAREAAAIEAPNGLLKGHGGEPHTLPEDLLPYPDITAARGSEGFWNQVRKSFVLPENYIHMNTGTTGSQPLFSLVNLGVYNLYKSMDPRDWQANLEADYPDLFRTLTERQNAVAAQYGAGPGEIVLSYNTTDACNLIFAGTPWNTGDRIITTHWEHPALAGPIAWARDYRGVTVDIVYLPSNFTSSMNREDILSLFRAKLMNPPAGVGKQYLAFSEIFYKNGLRMPVKDLCALAKSFGAYTIVDTAHGWGMLPIDCHAYGADFICGAGHKWLCGGPGTGIFYIRNSGGNLPPFAQGNWASYGDLFRSPSLRFNDRSVWSPSAMQGRGEANTPALFAMTDSAAYFGYLGVEHIYARGVDLANYLKTKIANEWGTEALWIQRNDDPAFATFLTAFNPFAGKDDMSRFAAMRNRMNGNATLGITGILNTLAAQDPKINIRTVTWRDSAASTSDDRIAFRVSTHAMYNSYEQIDYMFDRLVEAVNAAAAASGLPLLG